MCTRRVVDVGILHATPDEQSRVREVSNRTHRGHAQCIGSVRLMRMACCVVSCVRSVWSASFSAHSDVLTRARVVCGDIDACEWSASQCTTIVLEYLSAHPPSPREGSLGVSSTTDVSMTHEDHPSEAESRSRPSATDRHATQTPSSSYTSAAALTTHTRDSTPMTPAIINNGTVDTSTLSADNATSQSANVDLHVQSAVRINTNSASTPATEMGMATSPSYVESPSTETAIPAVDSPSASGPTESSHPSRIFTFPHSLQSALHVSMKCAIQDSPIGPVSGDLSDPIALNHRLVLHGFPRACLSRTELDVRADLQPIFQYLCFGISAIAVHEFEWLARASTSIDAPVIIQTRVGAPLKRILKTFQSAHLGVQKKNLRPFIEVEVWALNRYARSLTTLEPTCSSYWTMIDDIRQCEDTRCEYSHASADLTRLITARTAYHREHPLIPYLSGSSSAYELVQFKAAVRAEPMKPGSSTLDMSISTPPTKTTPAEGGTTSAEQSGNEAPAPTPAPSVQSVAPASMVDSTSANPHSGLFSFSSPIVGGKVLSFHAAERRIERTDSTRLSHR
jgi:hypothetical protein